MMNKTKYYYDPYTLSYRPFKNQSGLNIVGIIMMCICVALLGYIFSTAYDLHLKSSGMNGITELENYLKQKQKELQEIKDQRLNLELEYERVKYLANKAKEDDILEAYYKVYNSKKSIEIILSFITGILTSIIASFIYSYLARKNKKPVYLKEQKIKKPSP